MSEYHNIGFMKAAPLIVNPNCLLPPPRFHSPAEVCLCGFSLQQALLIISDSLKLSKPCNFELYTFQIEKLRNRRILELHDFIISWIYKL